MFSRSLLTTAARNALATRISDAAQTPSRLVMAQSSIDHLLDTWPLASVIDEARERWTAGPDGWALAVLARTANVLSPVLGWPSVIDRRWLLPGLSDLRQIIGEGEFQLVPRGRGDGAPAVSVGLDIPMVAGELAPLPPVISAQGDELADTYDAVIAEARAAGAVAVRFESPVPWDDASRSALDDLYQALPAQRAFDRYGHAGLVAPDAPSWDDILEDPPAGSPGPRVRGTGDLLILPTLEDGGRITQFGAVVWDAPYKPLRLVTAAAAVLQRLDGKHTIAEVADDLNADEGLVQTIVTELVKVGAASA